MSTSDSIGGSAHRDRCVAVVGTSRRVGKTVVAAALAKVLAARGVRVGVFKPVALGCPRRLRQGLVCPDAEFLAHCADAPHDLATINPVRYARSIVLPGPGGRGPAPLDLAEIERCRRRVTRDSDFVVIEAAGGLLEPLDGRMRVADLLARWGVPLVVVAPAAAEALNQVLMALEIARWRRFEVAAVVLNRYVADGGSWADEVNPEAVAHYGRVELPVVVPHDPHTDPLRARLGADVLAAIKPLANLLWATLGG